MSSEDFIVFLFFAAVVYFLFGRSQRKYHKPLKPDLSDPNEAIKYVQANHYNVRPIINKSAYRVFKIVEDHFRKTNHGNRVIPELCMGAVLECSQGLGHASINSKRIDIGVIDAWGKLVLAIEYNGTGHYQGNAAGRDAVKKMALTKARVPFVEITPADDETRILEKIQSAIAGKL